MRDRISSVPDLECRRNLRKSSSTTDSKMLPFTFIDLALRLKPKIIRMEEVVSIQAIQPELTQRLVRRGYKVSSRVLSAADYGVAQNRRRMFLVATTGAATSSGRHPSPESRPVRHCELLPGRRRVR